MPAQEPLCRIARYDHFNICTTLDISSLHFYERARAEHPGIEVCFDSLRPHHRRLGNKQLTLDPGKIMTFNAMEEHVEECSKNGASHHSRAVIIDYAFVDQLTRELGIQAKELVFTNTISTPTAEIRALLGELVALQDTPGSSYVAFDCVATELVLELLSQVGNTMSGRIRAAAATGYYPRSFDRAKKIMHELLSDENVSLERVASLAGLSKFHFARLFKRCTGLPPMRYYNQLKIDFVKDQLRHTAAPITDIVYKMGYSDISTFEKSFKKLCGLSPSQYRRQNV